MQISITFDPTKDSADSVAAAVAAIYGSNRAASLVIRPADMPDTGASADSEPAGGEVSPSTIDASGICWDERIHAKPPKINASDKLYRRKRGVDELTVNTVTAEIRAKLSAAATPTAAPAPSTPALPTPPAAAPSTPALPTPPAVTAAPTPYESFVTWIGQHVAKATMGCTAEWVAQALAAYGVKDGALANMQHMQPDEIATIRTAIAGVLGEPAL